ncbi:hypothetical protein RAJCM14343_5512 [Rhodococcus aetherivorans]|uniref:Uncharacterized protein n=1 Tax=Rhodococcus aetherivorans TaxID=191292 RepID=A0ABQ0YUV4_9NOCA|nr:hypothetical protein RAJCM14343_5512 [Rhodococcus aetherivorans]
MISLRRNYPVRFYGRRPRAVLSARWCELPCGCDVRCHHSAAPCRGQDGTARGVAGQHRAGAGQHRAGGRAAPCRGRAAPCRGQGSTVPGAGQIFAAYVSADTPCMLYSGVGHSSVTAPRRGSCSSTRRVPR